LFINPFLSAPLFFCGFLILLSFLLLQFSTDRLTSLFWLHSKEQMASVKSNSNRLMLISAGILALYVHNYFYKNIVTIIHFSFVSLNISQNFLKCIKYNFYILKT
jgi:hypothetical protein